MKKYSLEGLTGEALESAKNFNEMVEAIESMKQNSEVSALKAKIETLEQKGGVTLEQYTELKNAMEAQGVELAKQSKNVQTAQMSLEQAIGKAIVEKQSEILDVMKRGSGIVEIDVTKLVGDITTANGTVSTTPPAINGVSQAPLGNINLRQLSVEQYMTVLNTSNGAAYAYTEAVPKDGDYTFVAEGTAKPQVDFTWDTKYATPKKIAAWVKLTEESVKDVAGLESVARDFLRKKHDLKKSKALLYATNTGEEPKGATLYGRTFSAGTMAQAIATPNFMDVVNACIVDIATTHNYEDETPYRANIAMINSVDFFVNVVSAKTVEGVPLYPMASLLNQVTIGGVTIIPDESVPAGKIFVADLSKYNITNYVPYMVKVGWVNDDFIKNQFVILGESRFHQFVKTLDTQAFIYDDIATIKAAITAPAVVAGN